jgi:hypothetical protein
MSSFLLQVEKNLLLCPLLIGCLATQVEHLAWLLSSHPRGKVWGKVVDVLKKSLSDPEYIMHAFRIN